MSQGTRYALAFAAAILIAAEAGATTITTTSFSTWSSAAYTESGSQFDLNWSGLSGTGSYDTSAGITLYGKTQTSVAYIFTGPDGSGWVLNGITYNSLNGLAGANDGVGVINVAAPSGGVNAVLLSIGSTPSAPLTLTLSDGEIFSGLSSGLFGLSISHDITWLRLSTTSGSTAVIDDFWYGASSLPQDSPTAEGATFILLGGGLLILAGAQRKLRGLHD